MKLLITKIQYLLLLLIISGTAMAQTAKPVGTVSGTLLDEQSKPFSYATVSLLKAKDSTTVKGTLSNDAGVYHYSSKLYPACVKNASGQQGIKYGYYFGNKTIN